MAGRLLAALGELLVKDLVARLCARRARRAAVLNAAAQADADAWLAPFAPILDSPARAHTARAGAHPYERRQT